MKYDAVIFDLFGTLVDIFSYQEHERMLFKMASVLSVPPEDFARMWRETFRERVTGVFKTPEESITYISHTLDPNIPEEKITHATKIRLEFTINALEPRKEVLTTLEHIKSQGLKIGLLTDCTAEVPTLWEKILFAPLIDEPVFSCVEGTKKPDPRIYHTLCQRLSVEPQVCLYIGDGSSQELTGASEVGMHPVLIRVPYEQDYDAYRINPQEWDGPVISSLEEVLILIE